MSRRDVVEGVPCPQCSAAGPHDREAGDAAGTYVIAACVECDLHWSVLG